MFTTVTQVKELTGYDVTQEAIIMAQSIIESYTGRVEVDVQEPSDHVLLGRATAYQAAYMTKNGEMIFEQLSAMQIMQFGQMVTFSQGNSASPFVAPLAVLACKNLSWNRIRSVKTGSIFDTPVQPSNWETT